MNDASGRMELWRRLVLLLSIITGLALFFYVAPAMVSVTTINWQQEQKDETKSISGFISTEDKRLSQLPLDEYIIEKTGGQVLALDSGKWGQFFAQVYLASSGHYEQSVHGNRVSEEDKDPFWAPTGPVEVFFTPDELPFVQCGLVPNDNQLIYLSSEIGSETAYFKLRYYDYRSSISGSSQPYRVAPGWLYHPYRHVGAGILVLGVLLYIVLPRRQKQPEDITYAAGSILAGDLAALLILLPFYGLPFLINGGTIQAFTGMWPISLCFWMLGLFGVVLFYYNAWSASYRIELADDALTVISCRGVQRYRFSDLSAVNLVSLRNPGWFRKLFLALAFLSLASGRTSLQPAGSALLSASAAYSGLEISIFREKPLYIWFTDQNGALIIHNFQRVLDAIEAAGLPINSEPREIEGFAIFM